MSFQRTGFGSRFHRILLSAYFSIRYVWDTIGGSLDVFSPLWGLDFLADNTKKLMVHTDKTLASEPTVANY